MQPDRGNRGETVPQGVRSVDRDPVADMDAFDRLPRRLRVTIARLSCRIFAGDVLKAVEGGFPVSRMEIDLLLFEKKYPAALIAEREGLA